MRSNCHLMIPIKTVFSILAIGLLMTLSGCAIQSHGMLAPAGSIALAEKRLLIEVVLLMLIVVAPVMILTPLLIWRYRRKNTQSTYNPDWNFNIPLEFLVWGVPLLIVAVIGYMVWAKTIDLDPYRPLASAEKPVEIQVVGLNWKWLFIYPEQNLATVNTLVIPANRPVHLMLTSDTVMLSLLIPRLVGQIYAMPGMKTQLNFEANQPGSYLGENTQYNGTGFSQQKFTVQALSPNEFSAWVAKVRAQVNPLDKAAYAKIAVHDIQKNPLYFSSADGSLFESILSKYNGHSQMQANMKQTGMTATEMNHGL